MSRELKPYERENELLRKIRQKKEHQHRRKIEVRAIKKGLERCKRTYERDVKFYAEELEVRAKSIDNVESQILALTSELKKIFPKPKPKPAVVKPKNGKVECDICHRLFSKSGIKGHKKACLKKQELKKIQEELEKLEIEETLEELDKEDETKIEIEAIVDKIDEEIDDIKDGD